MDTGPYEFQSVEDMEKWLQEDIDAFSWLAQAVRQQSEIQGVKNQRDIHINALKTFVNVCRSGNDKNHILVHRDELLKKWTERQNSGKLITHLSPRAKYCSRLIEEHSIMTAAYAMCGFMNIDLTIPPSKVIPEIIVGISLAACFMADHQESKDTVASSFSAMQQDWNEKFHSTNQELHDELKKTRGDVADTAKAFKDKIAEADEQLAQQTSAHAQQLKDAEEKWHALEELYNKQLALQAPVEYWRRKKTSHAKWMWGTGIATAVIAIAVLLAFLHYCGTAYDAKGVTDRFVFANLSLKNVGMLIVISTFGIWFVRLGSKMFVSNLHLRTDAIERETMVQTYLALLKEDDGMSEDARNLMLQSIFRPATSGMVKDEGPINIIEMAGHAVSKKAGG
ncbi:MAG: hypothetical protein JXX14_23405 [Deltaproteobacteria bacterium]|nr:hypothetical protein [Deltaproteobacteria bacterium]